ncbi:MAG: hypothetical protein Q9195_008805 [Heterodermia aff. obscurata]
MTQPRTAEEVFSRIADEESKKFGAEEVFESISWVEGELREAQASYPFMREKTADEYYDYHVLRLQNQYLAKFAGPTPTDEEFWNAAYDFDPLDSNQSSHPSRLQEILRTGRMGPITLGKVYGRVTLKLLPALGALPENPNPPYDSQLDFAGTGSGAISYPDGHPPGTVAELMEPGPSLASLSSERKKKATIKPSSDGKLRRFTSLGFILQKDAGFWKKTGHVLVIDMDHKHLRHRQPWLVLASEWPTDGEETEEGDFTCRATETVLRPDKGAAGVLPGDNNRTPICEIRPMDESKNDIPVLKQFGEGFRFKPVRYGGHRKARPSRYGPDLAKVMPWYWDPKEEQEVCFTKEGLEYMRYDRKDNSYSFPDLDKMSFAGEQGFEGELEGPATLEVPRSKHRATKSSIDGPPVEHRRYLSSVEGF